MKRVAFVVSCVLLTFFALAQPGEIDLTFNSTDVGFGNGDGSNNYELNTIEIQNDGKLLIGGDFTYYNGTLRNRLARLNGDGTLDLTFVPGLGAGTNNVNDIKIQSDGKIIIVGNFSTYFGNTTNNIVRLNNDGSYDATFNCGLGANQEIYNISIQNDGKIIIVGEFTAYNGITRKYIARINSDGTLDTTFNPGTGADYTVNTSSIQSDGKIIIAGDFTTYNGTSRNRIARINSDGSLDPTFNPGSGANTYIYTSSIQSDGKIFIGGAFTTYNGTSRNRLARLNTDGTLDPTFNQGTGTDSYILTSIIQSDGKIIIGGGFTTYNGIQQNKLARLNTDGSIDVGFNVATGANNSIENCKIQSDGKILIGGMFTEFNSTTRKHVARINADGTHDLTFNLGSGSNNQIWTTSIQDDGKIIIGGNFTTINGTPINRIARLNLDGTLDNSFGTGTGVNNPSTYECWVTASCIQDDGKIIIAGSFSSYNGITRNNIARINTDGTLDASFNPGTGPNNTVRTISVQSDGKIIIGGDFTIYNGTSKNYFARLNTNGTLETSFNPVSGPNDWVWATAIQNDGKIIIAGDFNTYWGTSRNRIARINTDGTVDLTFNPGTGANLSVRTISIQGDGKIIFGGDFTTFNGATLNRIGRLNSNGTFDNTFASGTGADDWVRSTAIQVDGKIIICGDFMNYNGNPVNRVARLNVDGTFDATFNSGLGANNTIYTSSIQSDGKIIIGGSFTAYNNIGRNRVSRICNNIISTTLSGPVNYCSGANFSVPYTTTGTYNTGNIFTVQLSDATGNFFSPTDIGNLSSTVDGTIAVNIPPTMPSGSGYRVRVVSSDPIATGSDNGSNISIYSIESSTNISACYSYTWTDGNNYTVSGQYSQTLVNALGCDSVATLNLTINQGSSSTLTVSQCDSFTINSQTYTTSGIYTQTIPNAVGCDSTITVDLTITNSTSSTINISECSTYTLNAITYNASGIYTQTLINSIGCDSIITLNLTLNSNLLNLVVTECDSFSLNGTTYYSTGNFTQTLTNVAGCDSIIYLDLTILSPTPITISNIFTMPSDGTICNGEMAIYLDGNMPIDIEIDANGTAYNSLGYNLITDICSGVHDLQLIDGCGDTLNTQFVIAVDSNYVFNNSFIDSLALDSLGTTLINCDIYYNGITTAYIDSIWAVGNTANVIWNIVDSNGSNYDTTTYQLNNGSGVYWLQLSVFCPNKAFGEFFTVTEAVYFNNGTFSMAGIDPNNMDRVEIFPNPTLDHVTINIPFDNADLKIYDVQSKLILEKEINSGTEISLVDLQSGIYFFEVEFMDSKIINRIIKQ